MSTGYCVACVWAVTSLKISSCPCRANRIAVIEARGVSAMAFCHAFTENRPVQFAPAIGCSSDANGGFTLLLNHAGIREFC